VDSKNDLPPTVISTPRTISYSISRQAAKRVVGVFDGLEEGDGEDGGDGLFHHFCLIKIIDKKLFQKLGKVYFEKGPELTPVKVHF